MTELLVFDNENLDGPITCTDLSPLRSIVYRHANLVMPGAAGARPYAPVRDQLAVTLEFKVTGRLVPGGGVHDDPTVGVEANLEHYRSLFTSGGDEMTGEHDIELHYAGAVFEGTAQVGNYAQARTGPQTANILVQLVVADGQLVEVGS